MLLVVLRKEPVQVEEHTLHPEDENGRLLPDVRNFLQQLHALMLMKRSGDFFAIRFDRRDVILIERFRVILLVAEVYHYRIRFDV